ncbi:Acetyltransferase (GNAT) domain-containing protein [Shouchella lonarensis]|uniref:Acetyltransferase (GNAT) domain-containing protein n=1 Tax=Shouchella lonarensis TaxID=1464122 RepID=A0A1G6GZZ3_9BACI|nr:Acetyltransferase (GNAT) domain-containing protein [Shouchella lonarensis]
MTTLTTERLVLRPFSETDAPLVERYASDPDVAKTALNIPHPYPEGGALTFIQSAQQQVEEGSALFFAMTEKGVGDCIGIISVSLATAHNRGELGY